MFVTFFHELKAAGVPVTLREYLTLMEAMEANLASRRVEDFYYLSRATLVKDERNLDKFDRVFGHVFKGLELVSEGIEADIPEEWLKALAEIGYQGTQIADAIGLPVRTLDDIITGRNGWREIIANDQALKQYRT